MPKREDENDHGTIGHDAEANEPHIYQEPSPGERRDANRVDRSSTSDHTNGIHNNRGNRRNRGKTDPRSNLNLGPWTTATNEAVELMLETERAIRNLSDSYKKHSQDIHEFIAIQQQLSELKRECEAKDEKIRMQKDGIAALTDLSRERNEELKREQEDITSEREAFEEEKKGFKKFKENAEKRAKAEAAQQKLKGEKELDRLKLEQSRHFTQEMEKLERQKKTLKDESQKAMSDLEADKSRLLKELNERELGLLKVQGQYNDMCRLRNSFEKETEELKVKLKMMQNEFGLESQGVDF
jgi:chromosome segregation ATPase